MLWSMKISNTIFTTIMTIHNKFPSWLTDAKLPQPLTMGNLPRSTKTLSISSIFRSLSLKLTLCKINLVCYKSIIKYYTDIYHSQYTIHTILKSKNSDAALCYYHISLFIDIFKIKIYVYHSQYTIHTIFKSNEVSFGKQN